MESIALQQGDCLKSSTSCSAVQHPCSSLWKSLRRRREKKSSVKATRRERERETLCVCIPFALVYERRGGSRLRLPVCTTFDNTKVPSMCSFHRAWKGMTKKNKRRKAMDHLTLWSSSVFFFTFFLSFCLFWKLKEKKIQKGMVLLHTLKCKALLSILL